MILSLDNYKFTMLKLLSSIGDLDAKISDILKR